MIKLNNEVLTVSKKSNSITFQVENLEKPHNHLEEFSISQILSKYSNKIVAHSEIQGKLVPNGFHSFLYGMYQAYTEHRPFTISPDMIWLVICQGFSTHVKFGKGTENDIFPHLNTKQNITIIDKQNKLGDKPPVWNKLTEQFTDQIEKYVFKELITVLRADFTTTGMAERMASEVTIMDTMKPYFEYVKFVSICGIPEITLEGSERDWKHILVKLSKLRRYNLDWWIDKLEPIIREFILASQGCVNKRFWMNMFKVYDGKSCMDGENADGWITNFYPYDRRGRFSKFKPRELLSKIDRIKAIPFNIICENLPKEIVCVDFIYKVEDEEGNLISSKPMEYWAGFLGLKQDKETYKLRPQIGWFVCHKDKTIKKEGDLENQGGLESRKYFNLTGLPKELLSKQKWKHLELHFKKGIDIPIQIVELSVPVLELTGKFGANREEILSQLRLKNMDLFINGKWEIRSKN